MRAALVLVLVAACGDGGGDGDGDGGASADGGGGADGAPGDADAGGGAFPLQGGLVSVTIRSTAQTSLDVGFYKTQVGGTGCDRVVDGACSSTTCPTPDVSGIYPVGAGQVIASDGTSMISAEDQPDGSYLSTSASGALFPPGTTLTATAEGGDASAFSADVTMPASVTVTDPASPTGVVIDRTMPRSFSWTPGTGDVYVYLSQGNLAPVYPLVVGTTVRCVFPSADGTGTIPAAILGTMAAGTASMAITGIDETVQTVGTFEVRVRGVTYEFVGTADLM
jgi:hypothetical protein